MVATPQLETIAELVAALMALRAALAKTVGEK